MLWVLHVTDELPEPWKPENLPVGDDGSSLHRYIGSGDMAALVAHYRAAGFTDEEFDTLTKQKNVSDVWLRIVHGIDLPRRRGMTRGLREENPLRDKYRECVGPCSGLPGLFVHPRMEFAGGSPDGLASDRVVELKTHTEFHMEQWGETSFEEPTSNVPYKYALQCVWLCGLTELDFADLFMGFGRDVKGDDGQEFFRWKETRLYRVWFDVELYAELEQLAERFYFDHVQTRRAPSVKPVANKRAFKVLRHGERSEG